MTLTMLVKNYYKTQQALQWWSCRQSLKMLLEAEKIRDDILQESFIIRRSLEILAEGDLGLSTGQTQEILKKINNFHQSLAQLSDRLFPVYIQDNLPLAIQYLLEPWFSSHSHISFHLDMPHSWRYESADRSLIILKTIEELLRISLPDVLTQISIYMCLQQQEHVGKLVLQITYPDISTLLFYKNLPEQEYICKTFSFLTSGKCICLSNNLSVVYYLFW
ncbi:hypothetical protein AMR41_05375 [Hapalosiphon sp. MRB220]|nr:hypothetical protein AMR41_05375 [Hapalosiphon sp. MRB220]